MTISERRLSGAVVLDLAGPLTGRKAAGLLEAAMRRHGRSGRTVIANLANVPFMDLAGLGSLVEAYRTMRLAGGTLKLAAITQRIHDLIIITRLLTVFDVFDSVEEAVGGPSRAMALAECTPVSLMSLGRIRRFLHRV